MTVARSAATRFASIEELLLVVAEHVTDEATLWSLCLSNWTCNRVFTPKLSKRVIVRVKEHDDEATVQRIVGSLVTGPYLHDLSHLRLIISNGPDFPEQTLEMVKTLISATACLKVFTQAMSSLWDSVHGDVPVSILVHLSKHCPQVEELHLRSGPELDNSGTWGFRDVGDPPTFRSVRVLICRSMGTSHCIFILLFCPNVETVKMTRIEHIPARGSLQTVYYTHVGDLIARLKPLKMDMCSSRGAKATYDCEMCDNPGMWPFKPDDARVANMWPWASGRIRQYVREDQVRHINYEYPHPEPAEVPL